MTGDMATNSGLLQQLSDELAAAVERAGRSVVRVNARRRLPASGVVWVTSEGGYAIVSANHVIERDEDITITTPDGAETPATLVGRDPGSDIALLTVAAQGLTPAVRASGDTRVGAFVLALGRAGDLAATSGVVSAIAGPWRGGQGRGFERLIGTDAAMFPGFSGGPLVDAAGNVLGLLSSHLGRGQSLAIPAAEVDKIVAALQAHGRVRRGYLGVGAQPARLPEALKQAAGAQQDFGLLLATVEEGGPADKAGLAIGDILVSIDGRPTEGVDDLLGALSGDKVGQAAAAHVLRGGQPLDVSVTVGERAPGAFEHEHERRGGPRRRPGER